MNKSNFQKQVRNIEYKDINKDNIQVLIKNTLDNLKKSKKHKDNAVFLIYAINHIIENYDAYMHEKLEIFESYADYLNNETNYFESVENL